MLRTTVLGVLGITFPSWMGMGISCWTRLAASSNHSPCAVKPTKSTSPSSQTAVLHDPAGELCGANKSSALLQQFPWHNPTCAITPDQINYVSFWWRRTSHQFSHMQWNVPDAWKFQRYHHIILLIYLFNYLFDLQTHVHSWFNFKYTLHSTITKMFKISLVFSIVRQW